jgi:hypothetical protein
MIKKLYLSLFIITLTSGIVPAQETTESRRIEWTEIKTFTLGDQEVKFLNFTDASNADAFGMLPVFTQIFPLNAPGLSYQFMISDEVFEPFDDQAALGDVANIDLINDHIQLASEIITIRKKHYSQLNLLPMRKNPETGQYEKLVQFTIKAELFPEEKFNFTAYRRDYADNSVLASGDWYKISVTETGIYKLTYEALTQMGMDFTGVTSGRIGVYGNGGKMLPERNSDFRNDDLQEIAIWIEDGGDGFFGSGDYILFYGEGVLSWNYVPLRLAFEHETHRYSDHNYYFITIGNESGKRIETLEQLTVPAGQVINTYNYYEAYSLNAINLIRSGSVWYSEEFSEITNRSYHFEFPKRSIGESVFFAGDFAARSFTNSNFDLYANDTFMINVPIGAVPQGSVSKFGNGLTKTRRFGISDSQDITIDVDYDKPGNESRGWINYLEINVMNYLRFDGGQMGFRNIYTIYNAPNAEFRIANATVPLSVWDVTDPLNVKDINVTQQNDTCSFVLTTLDLLEFHTFDHSLFLQAEYLGKIENQNLHSLGEADFIIVSHPDFWEQAERLKAFHEEIDQMIIHLVAPQQIYNEFSSGKQDPTAIRDFVKMIYDRSGETPRLKYLLLIGDGSYDPKDRIENNKNFIVTFQSRQSLIFTTSYVTDDFFGLMDDNEGHDALGNVDIGIGRFPVNTPEQAETMVDKVIRYMTFGEENAGHWRNSICFIADDEDNNLHIFQADTVLVNIVTRNNESIKINKIYFDAYQQITTSAGKRYPEVTAAFNEQVNKGTLFVNYTGHGGEIALADERIIQMQDILSWNNKNKMPVFITATCEFTPYDKPGTTSAGELVVLNPNGGGVALMSTTRIAFASSNLTLNRRIYDTLFRAEPGDYPRLGDLIMFSKNPSNTNIRNFTLFGNPALKLAFPEHNIIIDSINGLPAGLAQDTIRANSHVSFSGYIADFENSQTVTDFDGYLYPVLYDKPKKITTLANDPLSFPYEFKLQQDILYEGKVSVTNGRFSFSFMMPRDINYHYGEGKLSLYAADSLTDASGYFNDFIVGGLDENAGMDNAGPEIELYLNDSKFVNGSLVNNYPIMIANLYDPSGINAIGVGIGHDIVAGIDGPVSKTLILNNHFQQTLNDYQSGSIRYLLENLVNGEYSLQLKAWDMQNNSSVATIDFIVSDQIPMHLSEVRNDPNPFYDFTEFTFRHNQYDAPIAVEINIYNTGGNLVKTISRTVSSNIYYIEPIRWHGTCDGGSKLNPGLYVYTVDVTGKDGSITRMVQKMIISH